MYLKLSALPEHPEKQAAIKKETIIHNTGFFRLNILLNKDINFS